VRLKSADISMVDCRSHVPARLHRQVKDEDRLEHHGLTGNLISACGRFGRGLKAHPCVSIPKRFQSTSSRSMSSSRVVRLRDAQLFEEDVGHVVVEVLPGVHQDLVVPLAQRATHRSGLDELRAGAHDGDDAETSTHASAAFTTRTTSSCCSRVMPGKHGRANVRLSQLAASGRSGAIQPSTFSKTSCSCKASG